MTNTLRLLATLTAILVSTSAFGSDPFHGTEMKLSFYNLEPGYLYVLGLSLPAPYTGFTGSTLNAPHDGLTMTPTEIHFKAPNHPDTGSKFVNIIFSVGAILGDEMTFSVHLPEPGSLKVAFRNFSHVFHRDESFKKLREPGMPTFCHWEEDCSYRSVAVCQSPRDKCWPYKDNKYACCSKVP